MSIIVWIGQRVKRLVSRTRDQFMPVGPEFDYRAIGDKINIRCPRCRDFVEYTKGAVCKCGEIHIEEMDGILWVTFSDSNRPTVYMPSKEKKLERR